jgi:hypothetical protein
MEIEGIEGIEERLRGEKKIDEDGGFSIPSILSIDSISSISSISTQKARMSQ